MDMKPKTNKIKKQRIAIISEILLYKPLYYLFLNSVM